MLTLTLTEMANDHVRGIYGPSKDSMPTRMRYLHPDAAASYREMSHLAVVSDMFRSAEGSLLAYRRGRRALPPAYSAHNYGLAVDLDIEATMERLGVTRKKGLDEAMEARGWFCHRRDHLLDSEAWHFNFLGPGTVISDELDRTSSLVEARIVELYGDDLKPEDTDCQTMLAGLKMYKGEIDGIIGPLSREGTRVFQRAWGLHETGLLDDATRRTLAYVSCERTLI